ncbi:MAG TPA: creatininase family protein [Burkholderiales bacterium]|nr:creatininase family protein [Burkholderiales bacterium]
MKLQLSTWPEVQAYLERSKGVVVPLGSTEQHGPNGLIGTDALCAIAIAEGLAQRAGALLAPPITVGAAQFNLGFAGTISARASTLMALIEDYVRSLARHGFERLYFLNGHGGNLAPAKAAFQDLYSEYSLAGSEPRVRMRVRSWWDLPTVDRMRRELFGDWEGMHATPSEVAITQALYPALVGPGPQQPPPKLSTQFLRDHAGDDHYDAATHRRHFPDGRVGSHPALASAEHGARLLEAAVVDAVTDYRTFLEEK